VLTLIGTTAVALPHPDHEGSHASKETSKGTTEVSNGPTENLSDNATGNTAENTERDDTPFSGEETPVAPPQAHETLVPSEVWTVALPDFQVEPQGVVPLPNGAVLLFAALDGRAYEVTQHGADALSGPGIAALKSSRLFSVVASPLFEQDSTLYAHVGFGSEQSVVSMTVKDNEVSALTTVYGPIPLEVGSNDEEDTSQQSGDLGAPPPSGDLGAPQQSGDLGARSIAGESFGALAVSPQGELFIGVPDILTPESEFPTSNGLQDAASAAPSAAQQFESRSGKVLRVDSSGKVPASNPLTKSPLWTAGHKTPVAFSWFNNSTLLELEQSDQGTELNVIVGGRNYGWPDAVGVIEDPNGLHGYTNSAGSWPRVAESLIGNSDSLPQDGAGEQASIPASQPTLLAANASNIFVGYQGTNQVDKLVYNGTTLFSQKLTVEGVAEIDALATTHQTLIVVGPNTVAFIPAQ